MSNMVLSGTIELPWPRGFQIRVTLDAFLKFLKSGAGRGHCVAPLEEGQGGPLRKGVDQIVYPFTIQGYLSADKTFQKNNGINKNGQNSLLSNLIWMQSLTSNMYTLVTVNHIYK